MLVALIAEGAASQPSNLEAFQQLAVDCMLESGDTLVAFRLVGPETMPYVRTALIARWSEMGKRVFVDNPASHDLPVLEYRISRAAVSYGRDEGRAITRDVTLALHVTAARADGSIFEDRVCTRKFTDSLRGVRLSDYEDSAFPETQAAPPPGRWVRRYLEPVVTVGAVAVAILLFFSLRSR